MKKQVDKSKQDIAIGILVLKIHFDYRVAQGIFKSVEPESFFELWIKRHIEKPTAKLKKQVWSLFLRCLFSESKGKK